MRDQLHLNKMHVDRAKLITWYLSIRWSDLEIGHTVRSVGISR